MIPEYNAPGHIQDQPPWPLHNEIYLQDTRFPSPPFEAYHESSYCRPATVKSRTSRRQLNIGPIEITGLGGLHYPDSATFFNKVSVV